MSELYSKEHLENAQKRHKTTTTVGILLPIFTFLLVIISCFFVKLGNLTAIKIVDGMLLVISAWASFYLLGSHRTELNDKTEHLEAMLKGERTITRVKIGKIGEPKTITFNLSAHEIFDANSGLAYYFESQLAEIPFSVEDVVDFAIVKNYIVAYEVKK